MRQPERPGYSSAKLFLLSVPLFLSRKPTASPYKLPFVPLISPWPLARTYLIRINARAARKLASRPVRTADRPVPTIADTPPPLPRRVHGPSFVLALTSLPEITRPRKVRNTESFVRVLRPRGPREEWPPGVVKTPESLSVGIADR